MRTFIEFAVGFVIGIFFSVLLTIWLSHQRSVDLECPTIGHVIKIGCR